MKMPTNPEAAAWRGPKAAWLWSRRKWAFLKQIDNYNKGIWLCTEMCTLCFRCQGECRICPLRVSCDAMLSGKNNAHDLSRFKIVANSFYNDIVAKGIELGYWTE